MRSLLMSLALCLILHIIMWFATEGMNNCMASNPIHVSVLQVCICRPTFPGKHLDFYQ